MIPSEYNTNKQLNDRLKYDIQFNREQLLNKVCADYIYDLLQYSAEYEVSYETQYKLLGMIENILGHKVDYKIISAQDRSRIYFGNVPTDFELTEDNIKKLQTTTNSGRAFEYTATTNDEKVLYAYPSYYGDITSILDQNSFAIKSSFKKEYMKINGIDYTVYTLIEPSFVTDYKILFA